MITKDSIKKTLEDKPRGWSYDHDSSPFADERWLKYNGERITTDEEIMIGSVINFFVMNQPPIDTDGVAYLLSIGKEQAARFLEKYYQNEVRKLNDNF